MVSPTRSTAKRSGVRVYEQSRVTALETVYRDALADAAPPLNQDRPRIILSPRAAAAALDICREAREAILINEKGLVRLTHLLLSLPPARPG